MPLARSSVASVQTTIQLGGLVQSAPVIAQLFGTGSVWSPVNTALTGVTGGNLLVSLGGWWNSTAGNGGTSALPVDTNGTLVVAQNPVLPDGVAAPGWPVGGQITHILSAAAGAHTFTPPNIGGSGDGYYLVSEFAGLGGSAWALVDSGNNVAKTGTPGAITTVTVSTAGAATQPGDLIVCLAVSDGNPSAVGLGAPTGYPNTLLSTLTTLTNIGAGAGWKIATASGTQSATWTWVSTDTQIVWGLMAVYRRS